MAFTLSTPNKKQVWSTEFTTEYVRTSGFLPYMGTSSTAIIRMDKKLSGQKGEVIHFPYFAKLSGTGVSGATTLMGSEDTLNNYSTAVKTVLTRNAVPIPESETYKTELDIANVARDSLKNWAAEKLRTDLITAGQSIIVAGGSDGNGGFNEDTYVAYGSASATQANNHLVANKDRILYGSARANSSSNVHATALATIAATQKLSAGVLAMAKTMAKLTSPMKINPYRDDMTQGREYFVLFVGPEGFRDLQNDPLISAANTNARDRGVDTNPIFQSGDLIYNGIIIREITEMPLVGAVGASGAQVGQAFLVGQGALAVAYSKMPEPRVQSWDYGQLNNVAIVQIYGTAKMSANGTQTGMVTLFHAAASDA